MSENEKNELNDMFGEEASPQENADTVIEIKKDSKMVEIPLDSTGKAVCEEDEEEEEPGNEPAGESSSASVSDAKKSVRELPGGASFVDELLEQCPDILPEFKECGKTLGGLYRWAQSFVKADYMKSNGATTGGMWWSAKDLARRYLSPEIKEGSVIEEPKCASVAKPFVPPVPSSAPKTEKKTRRARVVAAVKRAAKAAKQEEAPSQVVDANDSSLDKYDFSSLI